jgi:hypothetical protein
MRASVAALRTERQADNELYDRGSDLVEAAAAIRRAACEPEAARAIPAVLGCIEAALQELLWASGALEQTSAEVLARNPHGCSSARLAPVGQRMQQGYANLQVTLSDGERAAAAARALAARALSASGTARPNT